MSVTDFNQIDFIGIDEESGRVSLTISDHLDWCDMPGHLQILQEKIYRYAETIDSGEIHTKYPDSKGRTIEINVIFKHDIPQSAEQFLFDIGEHLGKEGIIVKHDLLKT
jgi:hypothetical protein